MATYTITALFSEYDNTSINIVVGVSFTYQDFLYDLTETVIHTSPVRNLTNKNFRVRHVVYGTNYDVVVSTLGDDEFGGVYYLSLTPQKRGEFSSASWKRGEHILAISIPDIGYALVKAIVA